MLYRSLSVAIGVLGRSPLPDAVVSYVRARFKGYIILSSCIRVIYPFYCFIILYSVINVLYA